MQKSNHLIDAICGVSAIGATAAILSMIISELGPQIAMYGIVIGFIAVVSASAAPTGITHRVLSAFGRGVLRMFRKQQPKTERNQ